MTCPFLEASLRNFTINFQGGPFLTSHQTRHAIYYTIVDALFGGKQKLEQAKRASWSSDNNWLRGHGRNPQCRISGLLRRGAPITSRQCHLSFAPLCMRTDPLSSSESPKLSIHSQKNANFADAAKARISVVEGAEPTPIKWVLSVKKGLFF